MADPALNDALAFQPFGGGRGVRFTVSAVASAPVGIPGTGAASESANVKRIRVRIAISGTSNACVTLNGTADRNCMVMLPGTVEVFTLPFSPNGATISAIAEIDGVSTTISACAGEGY